jgi:hypothetical protein
MLGQISIVKRRIGHARTEIPTLEDVRNLAIKVVKNFSSQALINTFLRRAFRATTPTIPVIFSTVGHYNQIKFVFEHESADEIDVLPLLNYPLAKRWLQTNFDDEDLPQLVFGIETVSEIGLPDRTLMGSTPAAARECFVCHGTGTKPMKCSGCKSIWYCGTDCQSIHWRVGHKKECQLHAAHMQALIDQIEEEEEDEEEETEF